MNRICFVASRKEVWATVLAALHQLMIGCQVSGFLGQRLSGSDCHLLAGVVKIVCHNQY